MKKKGGIFESLFQKINRSFLFSENPFTSPRTRMVLVCSNLLISKARSGAETKDQATGWPEEADAAIL